MYNVCTILYCCVGITLSYLLAHLFTQSFCSHRNLMRMITATVDRLLTSGASASSSTPFWLGTTRSLTPAFRTSMPRSRVANTQCRRMSPGWGGLLSLLCWHMIHPIGCRHVIFSITHGWREIPPPPPTPV